MNAWSPMLQSDPMTAPLSTWANAQTLVPTPTVLDSHRPIGWTKTPGSSLDAFGGNAVTCSPPPRPAFRAGLELGCSAAAARRGSERERALVSEPVARTQVCVVAGSNGSGKLCLSWAMPPWETPDVAWRDIAVCEAQRPFLAFGTSSEHSKTFQSLPDLEGSAGLASPRTGCAEEQGEMTDGLYDTEAARVVRGQSCLARGYVPSRYAAERVHQEPLVRAEVEGELSPRDRPRRSGRRNPRRLGAQRRT